MATRLPGQGWRAQVRLRGAVGAGTCPPPAPLTAPQGCAPRPAASVGSRRSWPAPASASHGCLRGQGRPQQGPRAHLASISCRKQPAREALPLPPQSPLWAPHQCPRCVCRQSAWQGWQPGGSGSPRSLQGEGEGEGRLRAPELAPGVSLGLSRPRGLRAQHSATADERLRPDSLWGVGPGGRYPSPHPRWLSHQSPGTSSATRGQSLHLGRGGGGWAAQATGHSPQPTA